MSAPPERAALVWDGEGQRFTASRDGHQTTIDGRGDAGPSPVALLLESVAACMAIDVADILIKGRQDLRGLEVDVEARRMDDPPRYVRWLRLEFTAVGDVSEVKARRAVELSFATYCSVYHSLRPDIAVEWEVVVRPADQSSNGSGGRS